MRIVNSHLLEKMDEAVHYINSHPHAEQSVHVDAGEMSLNVHDDGGGRVVTIMHQGNFQPQLCRQISVGEQQVAEGGAWGEELLDPESRLAALVAHLSQNPRNSLHTQHKVSVRSDMDQSVLLDGTHLRMYTGHPLDSQSDSIVVEVPALPPLQEMKRCPDPHWFHDKDKNTLKEVEVEECDAGGEVVQHKQSKKSLPHKKRISKKLKRNTNTPQQDIVVINCSEDIQVQEEILPDNFVSSAAQHPQLATHHEVRPQLICQLCGDYFGAEQVRFYHHLKQHYEPSTIIIENPVSDLNIDKMTNTCIVDNVATLPDSIVELSLENTVPKTMYQTIEKHILYTSSDKTLNYASNKVQYSMAPSMPAHDVDKPDLYASLDKMELFGCMKCNKPFRSKKQCEAHIKEFHNNTNKGAIEDMSEFSEPEDLMEGIHVSVEETDHYLPHLCADVATDQHRHWYVVRGSCGCGACPACQPPSQLLSREDVQKIFDSGVTNPEASPFPENLPEPPGLPEPELRPGAACGPGGAGGPGGPGQAGAARAAHDTTADDKNMEHLSNDSIDIPSEVVECKDPALWEDNTAPAQETPPETKEPKKKQKQFVCAVCSRVFSFRNSLLYHALSHSSRQFSCEYCDKQFFTANALKVHQRVHNNVRPYRCEDCGNQFRQWSDLKYHQASIHSDEKNHKCEFCGKQFARKYSLSVHRRIHTGEKNYKCEYCNKSFSASSYKTSHMRTHTGDKPYKCEECGKCFRVAGDLKRHQKIHEKARLQAEQDESLSPAAENKPPNPRPKSTPDENPLKKPKITKTKNPPTPKPKKNDKKPAPNVTVLKDDAYKFNANFQPNVEEIERELKSYSKFKEYTEPGKDLKELHANQSYLQPIPSFKVELNDLKHDKANEDRYVVLRSLARSPVAEKQKFNRAENTDGKMIVFTHVEPKSKDYTGSIVANNQSLNVGMDRDVVQVREGLNAEGTETAFIERLTALYNISAV